MVNVPTRPGVVLPAIKRVLHLHLCERGLAVECFLPRIVHVELQSIRVALEQRNLQTIVSAVVGVRAAVEIAKFR